MHKLFFVFTFISTIATAQITDDFSDGNFSSSPPWNGDVTEFIVNSSGQLQLNNSVAGASFLSSGSPAASLNNTEWRFYIRQSFAPSSSNYGRVYLASDQANLEGALNGYYLQFGESGSMDAVELFRQTGTTSTSVARGTNGQIAAAFSISVKVTRDASGNWSLYVDPAGGTAFSLEASGTDNTHGTTAFFGVATVYTVSYATKFYFDDFYNGAIVIDSTPPAILSSNVISATQLDVLFNEPVDPTTSQVLANYSADNSLGNPVNAIHDGSNSSLVHLTFATNFTNALANTLTVTNVEDLSANAISTATTAFTYFAPVTAVYKDIIITEIFADPSPQVALPLFEYVEIYNRGSNTFNLNSWKLTDGSALATLTAHTLLPGQYLIICPVADTASFSPYGPTMGVSSFPSLNNSGDNIYLENNSLTIIDSVNYSDAWYRDVVKKDGGWSLELINPDAPAGCPVSNNWTASVNASGGTPGIQNSVFSTALDVVPPAIATVTVIDSAHITVCFSEAVDASSISAASNYTISGIGMPAAVTVNSTLSCADLILPAALNSSSGYTLTLNNIADCSGNTLTSNTFVFNYYTPKPYDVVINEIMADPDPQAVGTNLPDYEYAELYNRTAFPMDLNNWEFITGTTIKVLPSVIIPPHGYVVIASATAAALFPSAISVAALSSVSLTNTGQTITLRTPQGMMISTVSYTDAWYQDISKKAGGWSLEQIDPDNPCEGMNNWRASVNPSGGTPGMQNSVNAANPDHTSPQVMRVSVIASDTIQLFFNESLDSLQMADPSRYNTDHGIGAPLQVKPLGPDFKSAILALGTSLAQGIIYRITINNSVTDCVGNPVGENNTVRFALPEPPLANDIVINEILYDPNPGGVDFVEIYNRSNKVIDLGSITISQFDTINNVPVYPSPLNNEGYLIFPGDYLLLSKNGNAVKSQYATTSPESFLDVPNLPSMNISSGTVCLASGFFVIDHLVYYANMQFPLLNVTKGVSLERINFERPSNDRSNWHSAAETVGFATPGYKNSQYSDGSETDNAIEISPEVFSPDEDGVNDVMNINYHFDAPGYVASVTIYDSKGRLVKNLVRNELLGIKGVFSWDGINEEHEKARIGIYIIFTEVFDIKGKVKHYKKTCVLAGKLDR